MDYSANLQPGYDYQMSNLTEMLTIPSWMNEIPEASNPENLSFPNKTPPLTPRPEKPSLLLSECRRTKPRFSKILNGKNENPITIGMSTAGLFRTININNTVDSKKEAKYLDKKPAKPETTVAKTTDLFALSDTTISAVDHFTIHHQQLKTDNGSIQPLNFASTKLDFKSIFYRKTLLIIFSQNTYFLNYFEISPRNGFSCKCFIQ